jgi:hypothetical protein
MNAFTCISIKYYELIIRRPLRVLCNTLEDLPGPGSISGDNPEAIIPNGVVSVSMLEDQVFTIG